MTAQLVQLRNTSQWRRAHQCHRDGCDSEARWRLHIHMQCIGIGYDRIALQMPTTLKLCNDPNHHKAALDYVFSDRNKANIVAGLLLNGFPRPDWDSAIPVFDPVDASAVVPG